MIIHIHTALAPGRRHADVPDILVQNPGGDLIGIDGDILRRPASQPGIPITVLIPFRRDKSDGNPGNLRNANTPFFHPRPYLFHGREKTAPHGFHDKDAPGGSGGKNLLRLTAVLKHGFFT